MSGRREYLSSKTTRMLRAVCWHSLFDTLEAHFDRSLSIAADVLPKNTTVSDCVSSGLRLYRLLSENKSAAACLPLGLRGLLPIWLAS